MTADQSTWGINLAPERITTMRASGAWHDRILTDFFDRHVAEQPNATTVVAWTEHGLDRLWDLRSPFCGPSRQVRRNRPFAKPGSWPNRGASSRRISSRS